MSRSHGPWTVLSEQTVYQDPWVSLRRDEVLRPDGDPGTYCVVHVKPGVCVVAMDDEGRLHLTEEFHYGVGLVTIEAVSGGVEPDEPVELAARRELREELGIEAEHWFDLGMVDPFTANVVSPTRLYLATKLTFRTPDPDGGELIRPHVISLADACEAIMASRITHAPSVAAILKVWYRRSTP